jgi:hypothetical protein
MMSFQAEADRVTADAVIEAILASIPATRLA